MSRRGASPRFAVVDRIEGDVVILEVDGEPEPLRRPTRELPTGLKEGDVVDLATGLVDGQETARRHEEVRALQSRLQTKPPSKPGGFDL